MSVLTVWYPNRINYYTIKCCYMHAETLGFYYVYKMSLHFVPYIVQWSTMVPVGPYRHNL